ncbi:unnamed protein product [Ixodes persulcatus]
MRVWSTVEAFHSENSLPTHLELAFALVEIVPENITKKKCTLFPLCLIEPQYLFRFVLKFC